MFKKYQIKLNCGRDSNSFGTSVNLQGRSKEDEQISQTNLITEPFLKSLFKV